MRTFSGMEPPCLPSKVTRLVGVQQLRIHRQPMPGVIRTALNIELNNSLDDGDKHFELYKKDWA